MPTPPKHCEVRILFNYRLILDESRIAISNPHPVADHPLVCWSQRHWPQKASVQVPSQNSRRTLNWYHWWCRACTPLVTNTDPFVWKRKPVGSNAMIFLGCVCVCYHRKNCWVGGKDKINIKDGYVFFEAKELEIPFDCCLPRGHGGWKKLVGLPIRNAHATIRNLIYHDSTHDLFALCPVLT